MISEELRRKLSQIVDFRVARGAKLEYPIEENSSITTPGTDGKKIYLPSFYPFSEEWLAYTVRHEADHIGELIKFSWQLAGKNQPQAAQQFIEEFFQKPEFEENPSLAYEIFNVVEDARIDSKAKSELPGAWEIFEKEKPRLMERNKKIVGSAWPTLSELDKFRQWFIERNFLGETVEEVDEKWKELLAQCEEYAREAQGKDFPASLEATRKIYQKFKENFEIRIKLKGLPQLLGKNQPLGGIKIPSEKRAEARPSEDQKDKKGKEPQPTDQKLKQPKEDKKGKSQEKKAEIQNREPKYGKPSIGKSPWLNEDREILKPAFGQLEGMGEIGKIINRHAGEIEGTIRVFRQLRKEALLPKRSKEGQEVDLQDYIQSELKKEATGIFSSEPIFVTERKHKLNPGWAILLDVSGSTGDILEEIKAAAIILAEALKRSNYQFGLFAFRSNELGKDTLYPLKNLNEKYSEASVKRILALESWGGTGMADSLGYLAKELIGLKCDPKGIIVVTDGEPNRLWPVQRVLEEIHKKRIFSIFICIGVHLPSLAEIVKEYIWLDQHQIDDLPSELLRIFRVYRL